MYPDLFDRGPWFYSQIVGDAKEVRRFATGNFLPGKLPLDSVSKAKWSLHAAFDLEALHMNGKPMVRAKARMQWEAFLDQVKRVNHQYSCKKGMEIILSGLFNSVMMEIESTYRI